MNREPIVVAQQNILQHQLKNAYLFSDLYNVLKQKLGHHGVTIVTLDDYSDELHYCLYYFDTREKKEFPTEIQMLLAALECLIEAERKDAYRQGYEAAETDELLDKTDES